MDTRLPFADVRLWHETTWAVLPLIVSFAFLLIADIDAPRHGLIEVRPQNLESLANSLGDRAR